MNSQRGHAVMAAESITKHTPYEQLPEWLTPEELGAHLSLSRRSLSNSPPM